MIPLETSHSLSKTFFLRSVILCDGNEMLDSENKMVMHQIFFSVCPFRGFETQKINMWFFSHRLCPEGTSFRQDPKTTKLDIGQGGLTGTAEVSSQ